MKILHRLLKGVSLTGALFVFQACYGMPQPELTRETGEALMTFTLLSNADKTPVEGIHVRGASYKNSAAASELGVTGADGRCLVRVPYVRNQLGPYIIFEDPEGRYASKDTTLADLREKEIVVKLYPNL